MAESSLRILMLATYFPKPGNPLMGTWALDQAQALARAGAQIRVISLTPWIPRWPGQRRGIRAYSTCPAEAEWGDLVVQYPRWLNYPMVGFGALYRRNPERWLRLAWVGCHRQVCHLTGAWRPNIIFAHHTCVNGWVAERLCARSHLPFFCQDHAIWEVADYCSLFATYRRTYQRIASKATAMLGVSQRMAADIRAVAPNARVEVLHNGANLADSGASILPGSLRPTVLFSAGMLVGWKGFDILICAWATLAARFPHARLRIAGDGPERQRLLDLCASLGVTSSVSLLGYLPQKEVHAEMAAARAFVLASWRETFAVVFFEAAAAGTPLIWSSNAGNAEVFVNGTHGLSIEPHSIATTAAAIEYMLTHPEQAARMGAAAQQLVRDHFTWDAVAKQAIGLFSAAVPSAAQPRELR